MKTITKKWLEYAKADLEGAETLLKAGKSQWTDQLCVWHCHQAIEKLLKTVIVEKGKEVKKVHNLIFLLQESELKVSKEFKEYIEKLNPHYQPPRYPDIPWRGPILRYNKKIAEEHIRKTKEIFLWIEKKLILKK